VRESRPPGSVRGAFSDGGPYRDRRGERLRGLNSPLSILFGDGMLVTEWGRIGSAGKVTRRAFQTEELAPDCSDKTDPG
jgi:hypothetical protein